jgi:hypothetical protein
MRENGAGAESKRERERRDELRAEEEEGSIDTVDLNRRQDSGSGTRLGVREPDSLASGFLEPTSAAPAQPTGRQGALGPRVADRLYSGSATPTSRGKPRFPATLVSEP